MRPIVLTPSMPPPEGGQDYWSHYLIHAAFDFR